MGNGVNTLSTRQCPPAPTFFGGVFWKRGRVDGKNGWLLMDKDNIPEDFWADGIKVSELFIRVGIGIVLCVCSHKHIVDLKKCCVSYWSTKNLESHGLDLFYSYLNAKFDGVVKVQQVDYSGKYDIDVLEGQLHDYNSK